MAYTTAAKVRVLLPTLLIDDDDLGTSHSGTYLTLNYPAFDVPTILKNGVELTNPTDFTFKRPYGIILEVAASAERYIAQVHRGISDADIDSLIATSDRNILAEFTNYDLPAAGYLEDWSSILTAARYLRLYAIASEENIDKAEGLEKLVQQGMDSFKQNAAGDTDSIIIKVNS